MFVVLMNVRHEDSAGRHLYLPWRLEISFPRISQGCDRGRLGGGVLPPILELYVVWHPGDAAGQAVAQQLIDHFRGSAYSGLIGGAVDVYVRSTSSSES